MCDLIDRQAAIDVLKVFTQKDTLGFTPKQIVEALPSAQPEIIRCKDCKHWDGKKNGGFCEVWDKYISNDAFFCGSAERREEDD